MKEIRKLLVLPLAGLMLGLATPVRLPAGSISYDVGIDVNWPGVNAGYLPQFNSDLGVLEGISFSGTINAVSPTGFYQPESSVTYMSEVVLTLFGLANPNFYFSTYESTATFDPAVESADLVSSFQVQGTIPVDSAFYGNGDLFLLVGAGAVVDSSVGFLTLFGASGGDFTFAYTYTAVPEPPGIVLAAIAAILPVAIFVRRRHTGRQVHA